MQEQALIRMPNGSFSWREERPEMESWTHALRKYSKTTKISWLGKSNNRTILSGFEVKIDKPNRRSKRKSHTSKGTLAVSIHFPINNCYKQVEPIIIPITCQNVSSSERFFFNQGELYENIKKVILTDEFVNNLVHGNRKGPEIVVEINLAGHNPVVKTISLSKLLSFSFVKSSFIHSNLDPSSDKIITSPISGIKVVTKLNPESQESMPGVDDWVTTLQFGVEEWNQLDITVRRKISNLNINLPDNDLTPVLSFEKEQITGLSKNDYSISTFSFRPEISAFEWTEPDEEGIGLNLTLAVGDVRGNVLTPEVQNKKWHIVDSNSYRKRFNLGKEMDQDINRWVDSKLFAYGASQFEENRTFKFGPSTLFISGRGDPPKMPPAPIIQSLDPRRRRPQIKYNRDLEYWKSKRLIHARIKFRYSNKRRQTAKKKAPVNKLTIKDKKIKKRGRKLPSMNRNRIKKRRG